VVASVDQLSDQELHGELFFRRARPRASEGKAPPCFSFFAGALRVANFPAALARWPLVVELGRRRSRRVDELSALARVEPDHILAEE